MTSVLPVRTNAPDRIKSSLYARISQRARFPFPGQM
jgi:hypothetical protein